MFSLAKELGMTVREMLSKMDSRELSEWMAYAQLESKKAKGVQDPDEISENIKKALFPKRADREK